MYVIRVCIWLVCKAWQCLYVFQGHSTITLSYNNILSVPQSIRETWQKSFRSSNHRSNPTAAALSLFHTYCLFAWKFSIRYRFTIYFLCSKLVGYVLFVPTYIHITYTTHIQSLISMYIFKLRLVQITTYLPSAHFVASFCLLILTIILSTILGVLIDYVLMTLWCE